MSEQKFNAPQPTLAQEQLDRMNGLLRDDPALSGMDITVLRSSGDIESDWHIATILGTPKEPLITARKQVAGEILEKTYPLDELLHMQHLGTPDASAQAAAEMQQPLAVQGSDRPNWRATGLIIGIDRGNQEHLIVTLEAPHLNDKGTYYRNERLSDLLRWQQEARGARLAESGKPQPDAEAIARLGAAAHSATESAPGPEQQAQLPVIPAAAPQPESTQPAITPNSPSEQLDHLSQRPAGNPEQLLAEVANLVAAGAADEALKRLPNLAEAIGGRVYDTLKGVMNAGGERYLRDPEALAAFIRSHPTFMMESTVRSILRNDYQIEYGIDPSSGSIVIRDPNNRSKLLIFNN